MANNKNVSHEANPTKFRGIPIEKVKRNLIMCILNDVNWRFDIVNSDHPYPVIGNDETKEFVNAVSFTKAYNILKEIIMEIQKGNLKPAVRKVDGEIDCLEITKAMYYFKTTFCSNKQGKAEWVVVLHNHR